jgi:hypothetical protein
MLGAFGPFIQLVDDVEILVGSYNAFIFYCQILLHNHCKHVENHA